MVHPKLRYKRLRSGGLYLHVGTAGEGPPVILLHGFPENAYSWRHQIEPLAEAGFSVWAPHLRGYPPSEISLNQSDYDLSHLIRDVASVLKVIGQARAHIVGHDWGGIIAWAFAGRYPEMVDKLVIINAPHMQIYFEKLWRSSQSVRSFYAAFFKLPVLPEKLLAANDYYLLRRVFRTMPRQKQAFSASDIDYFISQLSKPGALTAALNYYRENFMASSMELARVATTEAPTMVLWGERDQALGTFLLDGLERFAPDLSIHRFPDAGHWAHSEVPEQVNPLLIEFLKHGNRKTA
jgi:pimeloyl-ACP methyl ester carboxylesterase